MAVKALEGYVSDEGEVKGLRYAHEILESMQDKPLDEIVEAIEENANELFLNTDAYDILFPGLENDERIAYIKTLMEKVNEVYNEYNVVKDNYVTWKQIVNVDNDNEKVHEAIIYKLNEYRMKIVPESDVMPISWAMINEQILLLTDSNEEVRTQAAGLLYDYTAGLVDSNALLELANDATETDEEIQTEAQEILLSNLLYAIYNKNTTTIVDNTVVYQPLDTLYREYMTIVEHEYNVSAAMLSRAVEHVNNAFSDCYELSHKVVVYLLHDMKMKTLHNLNLLKTSYTTSRASRKGCNSSIFY